MRNTQTHTLPMAIMFQPVSRFRAFKSAPWLAWSSDRPWTSQRVAASCSIRVTTISSRPTTSNAPLKKLRTHIRAEAPAIARVRGRTRVKVGHSTSPMPAQKSR